MREGKRGREREMMMNRAKVNVLSQNCHQLHLAGKCSLYVLCIHDIESSAHLQKQVITYTIYKFVFHLPLLKEWHACARN